MASFPEELLRYVLDLAYPPLDDGMVDFEHERQRKSGLLSVMLVSKLFCAVARPIYESFVAFGSSEEVEKWIKRVDAGEIDAEAVRDVTFRPVFEEDKASSSVDEIVTLAARQTLQMLAGRSADVDRMADDILCDCHGDLFEKEERRWTDAWQSAARRCLPRLTRLRIMRFTEIEVFLGCEAISLATHCTIETIEWETAILDAERGNADCYQLWTDLWALLDLQGNLNTVSIQQSSAYEWAAPCISALPASSASRLQHLTLGHEIGRHAMYSKVTEVPGINLRSLTITNAVLCDASPLLSALSHQQPPLEHVRIKPALFASPEDATSLAQLVGQLQRVTQAAVVDYTTCRRSSGVIGLGSDWLSAMDELSTILASGPADSPLRRLRIITGPRPFDEMRKMLEITAPVHQARLRSICDKRYIDVRIL